MNYFLEPINLTEWYLFKQVCQFGYIEKFLATKEMQIGDMLFLFVTNADREIPSGIYANAIIMSNPHIIDDRRYVDGRIKYVRFDEPILNFDICKKYLKQFRSVHKIADAIMIELMKTDLMNVIK